jgi:hypothetical protein
MHPLDVLRRRIHDTDQFWYPGRVDTDDERLLKYVENLLDEVESLRKFRSDEYWRRDQESEHRMGL